MKTIVLVCFLVGTVIAVSHAQSSLPAPEKVHPAAVAISSGDLLDANELADQQGDTAHIEEDSPYHSGRAKRSLKFLFGGYGGGGYGGYGSYGYGRRYYRRNYGGYGGYGYRSGYGGYGGYYG